MKSVVSAHAPVPTVILAFISHHAKAAQIIAAITAVADRPATWARASAKPLAEGVTANRWDAIVKAIFEPWIKANTGPPTTFAG
jgi:hypothetical protein